MSDNKEDQPNRIRVFLRIRPTNKEEDGWFASGQYKPICKDPNSTPDSEKSIILDKTGKKYDFDKVFREESTQKQLFRDGALPTLENVFQGYCGAVLAYGQTGTGKTHTMQGYDRSGDGEGRGIIPRSAEYIFNRIKKTPDINFEVTISFVQIYLDKLSDLFKPDAPEISINPETERVELPGITQHRVSTCDEVMNWFYKGEKLRITRKTKMNPTSSRGHAALIVNVVMHPKNNDGSQAVKHGKLVLVDLAGYERFAQTGITTGIAAEEAKKINASLLSLGSVVNALAEACQKKGQHHIPYRNAKLTRLLKDCLGGTSVTAIICTINPCDKYNQETSGTLYFGWRAMAVKVDAKIKEIFDPAQYTANLKSKLQESQERIKTMVTYWSRSDPKGYKAYVAKFGEPDVSGVDMDMDEDEIMATLARAPSTAAMAGGGAAAGGAMSASMSMPPAEFEDSAPAAVQEVQKAWNEEINQHAQSSANEEQQLRLRHLADLKEAKDAGVDQKTIDLLKKEHEDELKLMREQNQLLSSELQRQKQKEEVAALLTAAAHPEGPESPDLGITQQSESQRIDEIVEHLQETCESKNEVLNRMFELICYYESQIQDYSTNVQAIAAAQASDSAGVDQRALTQSRQREEELRTELFLRTEEVSALKRAAGGASSLDTKYATIVAPSTDTPEAEELKVKATILREELEDAMKRLEACRRGSAGTSNPTRTRPGVSVGPGVRGGYGVMGATDGTTEEDYPAGGTKEKERKSEKMKRFFGKR